MSQTMSISSALYNTNSSSSSISMSNASDSGSVIGSAVKVIVSSVGSTNETDDSWSPS